jgi:hypothetical protein
MEKMPYRKSLRMVLLATLCAPPLTAAIVSIPVGLTASMDAKAASPRLGNLAKFRTIATDANALLETGDVVAAKIRLKNLETSWDEAEAGLKPRAAAAWHEVDKAIDRTLAAVRTKSPDLAACKAASTDLIAVMNRVGGPT